MTDGARKHTAGGVALAAGTGAAVAVAFVYPWLIPLIAMLLLAEIAVLTRRRPRRRPPGG